MKYFIVLAALAAFVLFFFGREVIQLKKKQEKFWLSLYENYGKLPEKTYSVERYERIDGYFKRHPEEGQLDEITWNDLNMDDVFKRLNYTFSATGEEYLYYRLRSIHWEQEQLSHFEEVVRWFAENADARVKVQFLMNELGHTGKYSLYEYIENLDFLGERSNTKYHILNALFAVALFLLPVQFTVSMLGIVVISIYQIVSYFKDKNEIDPYIVSFAYVMRLLSACEKVSALDIPVCKAEQEQMQGHIRNMKGMRSGSFWVFSANQSKTSGNPIDLIMDYIRMVFHVDLIVFNKMLREIRAHLEDVDGLITIAGYYEAAIATGAFRASLKDGWCVPESVQERGKGGYLVIENGYHPLLEHPVKNSIDASKGVLLTGSNASGKSTFLKMTAVNTILAQTIHTCAADRFLAPKYRILSSMALRDDINSGESYYIVEIKALKRILDTVSEKGDRVLCFVDEVLRGTNTVERIAASTQILKSFVGKNVLCFAATHDVELTELLQTDFDNYHFEEEIRDGDVCFNYRIQEGRATTRNAIRLLEMIGYAPEIMEKAETQAQAFLKTGTWQST